MERAHLMTTQLFAISNEAEVTGHLSVLTEVLVDMDKSTEDFYRVLARNGVAGFCPKKYVAIRR